MENQQAQIHGSNIDVLGKKEEKNQDDAVMVDLDQSKDKNNSNGGRHTTLIEELQRTRSHSGSSSDEEVEGGERKRKKKKGLKDNIKEKLSLENDEDTTTPQNIEEDNNHEAPLGKIEVEAATNEDDKKGFLEKIKDKLNGHHKTENTIQDEQNTHQNPDKKGLLEKIKEKLPGNYKNEEENDIIRKEKHN